MRAYPISREWLALLIRRMAAVAAVYRLTSSLSPGIDALRSHVEFHRRDRFDATITLHDGRDFGVVRYGPQPVVERPAAGHSGVRLHPPPRSHPDTDAKRLGAEADDPVLHGPEHGRLLRRRGVEGGARRTRHPRLAADLVPVRGLVLHTGNGELPRQSDQSALHRVAES